MNDQLPTPDTQPATDATPPKPLSLVARMLKAGEAMLQRRAAKRAEQAAKVAELPWWKRIAQPHRKVLVAVRPSQRNTAAARQARQTVKLDVHQNDKALTKAQRKRRNREARARA